MSSFNLVIFLWWCALLLPAGCLGLIVYRGEARFFQIFSIVSVYIMLLYMLVDIRYGVSNLLL